MYNFDYNITYNCCPEEKKDAQYQKDILGVFNLTNKSVDFKQLNKIQEQLYENYKNDEKIIKIIEFFENNQTQFPFKIPKQTYFVLLFQYDYFFLFHICLQDLNKNNEISEINYNNIIFLIKKNS